MSKHKKDENNQKKVDDKDDIDQFFDDLRAGSGIKIWRVLPEWCTGYLGTIYVSEEEPIDVEQIIKRWGGRKLRLKRTGEGSRFVKGSVDLDLKSYPPKVKGDRIYEDDEDLRPRAAPGLVHPQEQDKSFNDRLLEGLLLSQKEPQNNSQIGDFAKLLDIVNTQQSPILQQLITKALKTPTSNTSTSSIDEVVNLMQKIDVIKGALGDSGAAAPAAVSDDQGLMTMIGSIANKLLDNRAPQPVYPPQAPQIHQPNPGLQGAQTGQVVNPAATPNPSPTPEQKPVNTDDIAAFLDTLEGPQLVQIMLTKYQNMPHDKKEQIKDLLYDTGISQKIVDELCEEGVTEVKNNAPDPKPQDPQTS